MKKKPQLQVTNEVVPWCRQDDQNSGVFVLKWRQNLYRVYIQNADRLVGMDFSLGELIALREILKKSFGHL